MKTTKYLVRRYFNGEFQGDISTHRTLTAAEKIAAKFNRGMGGGWGARIYCNGERVDC